MIPLLAIALLQGCATPPEKSPAHAAPTPAVDTPQAAVTPTSRRVDPPAGVRASAHTLADAANGAVLTWLEPTSKEDDAPFRMQFSRWTGTWSEPVTIVESADLFVNWADTPGVVASSDGVLYAHWLQRSGEATYAYDVMVARSSDGLQWTPMGKLHDDATQTEHGFVSWVPEGIGVRAFWLDGRMTVDGGPMGLRTALVGERVAASEVVDSRTCDCCGTAAVATPSGPVVFYRDRTQGEIRDVYRAVRQGTTWVNEVVTADGWHMEGCPVNGPAAAVSNGQIATAWLTGIADDARVQLAWSADGGRHFDKPVVIDGDKPTGRTGVAAMKEGVLITWIGRDEAGQVGVRARTALPDGTLGPARTLSLTTESRASGFPRVLSTTDGVLAVWTEPGEAGGIRATLWNGL